MVHKVYVSGPMRGYPQFNFPAFFQAAAKLRGAGHTVFCPAERDTEQHGIESWKSNPEGDIELAASEYGFDLRAALASDCKWICETATAVFMLRGWEKSKGALAERALADALGHVIWYQAGAVRPEGDRG